MVKATSAGQIQDGRRLPLLNLSDTAPLISQTAKSLLEAYQRLAPRSDTLPSAPPPPKITEDEIVGNLASICHPSRLRFILVLKRSNISLIKTRIRSGKFGTARTTQLHV